MAKANHKSITADDPIHLAIERHRSAARLWAAAVAVRAAFPDVANPMTMEQQAQIDAAVAGARLPLIDAGLDLIETGPTTCEGIVAALEYMRDRLQDDDDAMPENIVIDSVVDDAPISWLTVFVATLADAAGDLLARGCSHQTETARSGAFKGGPSHGC
jgi:hypothetical protein